MLKLTNELAKEGVIDPKTRQYLYLTLDEFNKYWSEKKDMNILKTKSGVLLKEKK